MKKTRKVLIFMIFLPLIFIIPINIVLLYNSKTQMENARQKIISENDSMIQMYAGMVETKLSEVENYIDYLTTEEYPFLRMAQPDFNESQPDFFSTQNQMIAKMQSYKTTNDTITNIMIYFDASDVYLNKDKLKDKTLVTNFQNILADIENQSVCSENNAWRYFEIQNEMYLACMAVVPGARCMITISVDELLENITKGTDETLYRYYYVFPENIIKEFHQKAQYISVDMTEKDIVVEGERYYNNYVQGKICNINLGSMIVSSSLNGKIPGMIKSMWIFSIITCLIGPIFSGILLLLVERPLKRLNRGMKQIENGNMGYRIPIKKKKWVGEFDELNIHFNNMLNQLEETNEQLVQEEIDRQKLELHSLNQQIKPHFILNALNIIYMYEDNEFPVAKKMVLYLTKYFRYLVNLKSNFVCLWEEIEFIESYLNIQKIRYPKRFTPFVEWEEELRYAKVPAVLIQTFVENCVKHGFENGNLMFIFVLVKKLDNHTMEIMIADTGKGFSPEILVQLQDYLKSRKYNSNLGVGIQNTVNKLDILYGEKYTIFMGNNESGGARVCIRIPLQIEQEEEK